MSFLPGVKQKPPKEFYATSKMLILHQTGSLKIGEVIRYTVTYTPSADPILPSPPHLYLKIKNTSAIALRAAFVHGPYTLYVSACPKGFRTDEKWVGRREWGVPEFEPMLKAGASWSARLNVPECVRGDAGRGEMPGDREGLNGHMDETEGEPKSVSWVIEVSSQVIFSTSASVNYEVLVGRDEKSLNMGIGGGMGALSVKPNPVPPGTVKDHTSPKKAEGGHQRLHMKGVYSRAVKLKVEDTAALWNCPKLPEWEDEGLYRPKTKEGKVEIRSSFEDRKQAEEELKAARAKRKQKKVHLVVVTHGLHSNLGADMLYLKESIDEATIKAKADAKKRRAARREEEKKKAAAAGVSTPEHHAAERSNPDGTTKLPGQQVEEGLDESEDEEEVIVRGFSGNAVRTEKGIKYLGKRLAKYVLAMTYPDQPFRPVTRSASDIVKSAVKGNSTKVDSDLGEQVHSHSSIREEPENSDKEKLAYKITSISFIAHSLGGLTQTYAVAYIQKHSPDFFDKIKGVNFITLATPFLGLSNENPLYVKFALDFGLVGRTGQDLGLTWRAPNIAKSGWGALVSGIGEGAKHKAEKPRDPGSKPLLRILPTGPAHVALKKFRNRTVYSNVVNDGIVPLRTSCLLFLDWQGLGRVEKARRENGLVGTMAGWGWAELTGQNSSAAARRKWMEEMEQQQEAEADATPSSDSNGDENGDGTNTPTRQGRGDVVPQPDPDAVDSDVVSLKRLNAPETARARGQAPKKTARIDDTSDAPPTANTKGPLDTIMEFFTPRPRVTSSSRQKIFQRSQTMNFDDSTTPIASESTQQSESTNGSGKTKVSGTPLAQEASAPPKTSFFEAAGDLLAPPLPPLSFLVDPESRPRTIFHDRVYHPEDIPSPPRRKGTPTLLRRRTDTNMSQTSEASTNSGMSADTMRGSSGTSDDTSGLKVEEKIARAYHRDLSWRKVLVRLQPDAHNNIIVRRKFANAYGWPVVKHLCDTHFSDAEVSRYKDEQQTSKERAKAAGEPPTGTGREVDRGDVDRRAGQGDEPSAAQFLNPSYRRQTSNAEHFRGLTPTPTPLSPPNAGLGLPVDLKKPPPAPENTSRTTRTEKTEDSAQWSDADFGDSDNESEFDVNTGSPKPLPPLSMSSSTEDMRKKQEEQKSMGSSAGGWNWTEAIVGKAATTHRPRSSGRGFGSWNRGGGSFGSVGSGRGALERVRADGHSRRDSREFTLHAPSLSLEDDEEYGAGDITPTQSNIEAPEPRKLVGDEVHRAVEEGLLVTSPGEVDGSLGLGIHPPQDDGHGVAERVARLSIGGGGGGSDGKDTEPHREELKRTETFGIGKAL